MGTQKLPAKSLLESQLFVGNLKFEIFCCWSQTFSARGNGEGGGVLLFIYFSNGEKQADRLIPHREPDRSILKKHGKLAGGIKSGVLSLNRS